MADREDDPLFQAQVKEGNLWPKLVIATVAPWLVFVLLLTTFGFRLHDVSPWATWAIAWIFILLCVLIVVTAYWKVKTRPYAARWNVINAAALLLATLCGIGIGDQLFWNYMWPYYQFQKTSPYVNVDPSKAKGQSIMDAGQVYFKEGTFVATEESIAYKMGDVYCAAPIVRQPVADHDVQAGEKAVLKPYSGTIDFWAIGVNCCMPSGELFRCYDAKNRFARSGLRLLRNDLRPFFKLAVEKWSSKYSMPVKHPLFFYWMFDPLAEIDIYEYEGHWRYWVCFTTYLFCNAGFVLLVRMICKKTGL